MAERKYTLIWMPTENANPSQVPYKLDKATGKLVYKLPPDLNFGHLEFNGVDVSGYFKPDDDEIEYSLRPWMFDTESPEETLPATTPETDESEAEAE